MSNTRCYYCNRDFSKDLLKTADHIIPLSRGGINHHINKNLCCFQCNNIKASLLPDEWLFLIRNPNNEIKRRMGFYTKRQIEFIKERLITLNIKISLFKDKMMKEVPNKIQELRIRRNELIRELQTINEELDRELKIDTNKTSSKQKRLLRNNKTNNYEKSRKI